jgi:hypothetical protein
VSKRKRLASSIRKIDKIYKSTKYREKRNVYGTIRAGIRKLNGHGINTAVIRKRKAHGTTRAVIRKRLSHVQRSWRWPRVQARCVSAGLVCVASRPQPHPPCDTTTALWTREKKVHCAPLPATAGISSAPFPQIHSRYPYAPQLPSAFGNWYVRAANA